MTTENHEKTLNELTSLLAISHAGLKSYAHGQLKYAANFAVHNFGHFWAMKRPVSKDPSDIRRLRFQIKKIVLESASGGMLIKTKFGVDSGNMQLSKEP